MDQPLAIVHTPQIRKLFDRRAKVSSQEQRLRRMEGMILIMAHGLMQGQITYTDKDQLLFMMSEMMEDIAAREGL